MAYIESFVIEGLAGRDEIVARTLDRHVNVFWGLNGTGKTSLLKILSSALTNDASMLRGVPFTKATVNFWSTDHEVKLRRVITQAEITPPSDREEDAQSLTFEGGSWRESAMGQERAQRRWVSRVIQGALPTQVAPRLKGRVGRPPLHAPYKHAFLPISRLATTVNQYSASQSRVVSDSALDQDFAEQVRIRWQTYNSDALASIRVVQQQGLAAILALLFGGGTGELAPNTQDVAGAKAYELVRAFLAEQNISLRVGQGEFLRRYETQSDLRSVVAAIQGVTGEVEDAIRPQREFQEVIESLYQGGKALVLDASRGVRGTLRVELRGERIPLQSLSSGEKQLLRLLLEVLAADTSTVMIDEPELSMHVDWQQKLIASMRRINPECQLLLATHSPEVMTDIDDRYVFQL